MACPPLYSVFVFFFFSVTVVYFLEVLFNRNHPRSYWSSSSLFGFIPPLKISTLPFESFDTCSSYLGLWALIIIVIPGSPWNSITFFALQKATPSIFFRHNFSLNHHTSKCFWMSLFKVYNSLLYKLTASEIWISASWHFLWSHKFIYITMNLYKDVKHSVSLNILYP